MARGLSFPCAKTESLPFASDPVTAVAVHEELGGEAVTFTLVSDREGTVHVEQVLRHNEDPTYVRDLLL